MQAAASFPAIDPVRSSPAIRPVVLVQGHPEPTLHVRRITWASPLNICEVELEVAGDTSAAIGPPRHHAIVATPRTLSDGQTRWEPLAVGRLERSSHTDTPVQHDRRLTLLDRWAQTLSERPQTRNALNPNAVRSLPPGTPLGQALLALSDHHQAGLSIQPLPGKLREAPLLRTLRLDVALRDALTPLLDDHHLFIQRDLALTSSAVTERRSLRPLERGRRIQFPLPRLSPSNHPVVQLHSQQHTARAHLWIARGARPRVESTVTLSPGWDPALEGQPDDDYNRSLSSDFSRFGNVYRRWVLNEDASLDANPFDLAAMFGQPTLLPTPLPFGDCLTLDDAGRPLPPVVEFSVDAGTTWSRYTQPVELMSDRAGVMLESIALPSAVFVAAKSQHLRLRVTASLTSPLPVEAKRWQGNPFADAGPEVVLDASARFTFHRLDPGSLHFAAVQAGQLLADVHDDTQAMADWLLDQLGRAPHASGQNSGHVRLTLSNARPEIRIGDQLAAWPGPSASIAGVRCDFVPPIQTVLTVRTR